MWVSKPPFGTPLNRSHSLLRGLLLWYPFLEGGGTVVRNPVNPRLYEGTFSGITPSTVGGWSGGKDGSSILFDGTNDTITTTESTAFNFSTTTFSVSGRFRTTSASNIYIFGKHGASSIGGWGVGVSNDTANKFGVVVKNTGASSNCILRSSSTSVNDGRWHSFAAIITTNSVTSGNNTCSIYIDGALDQGSATISGTSDGSSSSNLSIGSRAAGNFFSGSLDDLRVYNRRLTQEEIWTLHVDPWQMFLTESPFALNTVAAGGSLIKTVNGLAIASVKTLNGLAIASVKTRNGLTNV